eukprot:scaffold38210_cov191-Amphora_coffeaeformis.AAC.10
MDADNEMDKGGVRTEVTKYIIKRLPVAKSGNTYGDCCESPGSEIKPQSSCISVKAGKRATLSCD